MRPVMCCSRGEHDVHPRDSTAAGMQHIESDLARESSASQLEEKNWAGHNQTRQPPSTGSQESGKPDTQTSRPGNKENCRALERWVPRPSTAGWMPQCR